MQITIDGEAFDLVSIDTLDFGEQIDLKRLTGGMSIEQITTGLETLDAEAWFGLILFSIRRKRPQYSADALKRVNFTTVLQDMNASIDQLRATADADAEAAKEAGSVVPLPGTVEPPVGEPSQSESGSLATRALHGLPA